jgi:hypothetical protein
MILGLLAGLLWFALFFAAHLAVIRWARAEIKARINQRLFLAGLAGIAISLWPATAVVQGSALAHGGLIMAVICGILSYVGLFVLYMPFYYTVPRCRSARWSCCIGGPTIGCRSRSSAKNSSRVAWSGDGWPRWQRTVFSSIAEMVTL